jgi:phage regulator Rha-like protein
MENLISIRSIIYEFRGERVIVDFDLARLYQIDVKVLNQSVKRNIKRFPIDFMFQLSNEEYSILKLQIVDTRIDESLRSQSVTLKTRRGQHRKYMPYVFTEQGVAMLSGVINSDISIKMNIAIMRSFVELRKIQLKQSELQIQIKEINEKIGEHDTQLNQIYDAMENLLDEKVDQKNWNERERIGFKK